MDHHRRSAGSYICFRAIENFRKECGNKEGDPHFFEISKDTELFYCPGDEYLADEQDCM